MTDASRNRELRLVLCPFHDGLEEVDLDPSDGIANRYAAAGGVTCDELLAVIDEVFDRFEVVAAAITAYDPDSDGDGRMAATAGRVIDLVAHRATRA